MQAGVISASAVLAGLENRTGVKSVSGEINAETVSGSVESRALTGDLFFTSVSGELTVAAGTPRRLRVTGRLGGGMASVSVTTVSGGVTLLRGEPRPESGEENV